MLASNHSSSGSSNPLRRVLLIAGPGQGAQYAAAALDEVNRLSPATRLLVTVLSPYPGVATRLTLDLHRRGVTSVMVEGRLDAQAADFLTRFEAIVVCDARTDTTASVLAAVRGLPIGVLTYVHIAYPVRTIHSLAMSTTGCDDPNLVIITLSTRQIQSLADTKRGGVFSSPHGTNTAVSQLCHGYHQKHLRRELPNHLAGVALDYSAVMAGIDGSPLRPMIILNQPLGPGPSSTAVAEQAARFDSRVLEPGQHYLVGELFPAGFRSHRVYVDPAGSAVAVVETLTVTQTDLTGRFRIED